MIEITVPSLESVRARLGDLSNKAPTVVARAINRAATSAKAEAKRMIKEGYVIAAGKYNAVIPTPSKANARKLATKLVVMDKPQEITNFKVSPKNPWNVGRSSRRPDAYRMQTSKSKSLAAVRGAFVIKTSRGNKLVMRQHGARNRFVFLYGPSAARMVEDTGSGERIRNYSQDMLLRRIEHEINYEISRGVR